MSRNISKLIFHLKVFSPIDTTTKDGYRVSTYSAYYKNFAKKSKNLVIKKYADVTKVFIFFKYLYKVNIIKHIVIDQH
jgi:hypothetical protein